MLHNFINIFAAPKVAFAHLRGHPSWFIPLLLMVVATSVTMFLYFQFADPVLLMDDMVEQAGTDLSDAEAAEARENLESMGISGLKWATVVGGSVSIIVFSLLQAGYFALVSMFSGTKIGFKAWWSFVAWASLPMVFGMIASVATLMFASEHVTFSGLNPLSMTNLLNIDSSNQSLVRLLDNIDLTRIWSAGLMIFGYRLWTDKSWLNSSLVVLAPLLLVYGGLFVMSL